MSDCGPHSPLHIGTLHPLRNETYALLKGLYTELGKLFPDEYVHVGGDEVNTECWQVLLVFCSWKFVNLIMED